MVTASPHLTSSPPSSTLRALLARADLSLRLVRGADDLLTEHGDRVIRWIHSSDLADPTPFLGDGVALLTTGTQFLVFDDERLYADYVARLSASGVVALGFGTEVVREGVPPALEAACKALDMPLFVVPYRTPFIAVARANAEAVAAHAYARRSWALAAQRAIALAALRPDGLGATLAELARQLGTWVGLFDTTGTLTRQHPTHGLDPATALSLREEARRVLRRGARAGSTLHLGGEPFTLQTLGPGGHLRGAIAIAAGSLDQESRGLVTAVIAMAGLALEQSDDLARARGQLRSGVIQSLLAGQSGIADRIAREMGGGLPPTPAIVAITDSGALSRPAVADRLELLADDLQGRLFFGRDAGGIVAVLAPDQAFALTELAEDLRLRVGAANLAGYEDFAAVMDRARGARDHAVVAGVVHAREPDGVLGVLMSAEAHAAASEQLAPLLHYDSAHGTSLVGTVRAWLEHDGSHEATARALGIHRHTVRARVAIAGGALGVDLTTFAARAEIWAALRALE